MGNETATVELPRGSRMPVVGLGTAGLSGEEGYLAVRAALDAGYRQLDTAVAYENEAEVGRAVRDSGLDRSAVFVTTKLPPERAGHEAEVLDASLRALGLDHLDLWLVHWPVAEEALARTWEAFIAAREAGKVREIGVSNYDPVRLDRITAATGVAPAVNQVAWSPARHDPALLAAHRARGIVVEGYSPLNHTDLDDPALTSIAAAHGVTPAQVVLRWHLRHDIVVIPKSGNERHLRANLDLAGLTLTHDEMATIDALASRPA